MLLILSPPRASSAAVDSFRFLTECSIQKSANKNGALADARVGPAASKRLHKVFTGLDPTSTDV